MGAQEGPGRVPGWPGEVLEGFWEISGGSQGSPRGSRGLSRCTGAVFREGPRAYRLMFYQKVSISADVFLQCIVNSSNLSPGIQDP